MRRQCQACTVTTDLRCKRSALTGSKYCWVHQPKVPLLASLILGALAAQVVNEVWRLAIPSKEIRELRSAQESIQDLKTEVEESQRTPDFQFFVNGTAITNALYTEFDTTLGTRRKQKCVFVIPTKSATNDITLTVRNTGDLAAERLVVNMRLPKDDRIKVGAEWKSTRIVVTNPGGFEVDSTMRSYQATHAPVVPPGAYVSCGKITLESQIDGPERIPLLIQASAMQAETKHLDLIVVLVPGAGDPVQVPMAR